MLEDNKIAGHESDDVLNINIDDLFKDPEESQPQEDTSNSDTKSNEPSEMTKRMTDRINDVRRKTETETQEKIAKDLGYSSYAEMQKDKEHSLIKDYGYDPDDIEKLVEPLLEKRLANDPRFRKLEELERKEQDDYIKAQLTKINKLSDKKFTTVDELPEETIALWGKGVDLSKAYLATAGEELLSKKAIVADKGTLSHLAEGGNSKPAITKSRLMTEEEKNFYKAINPYITDEELAKKTVSLD